MGDAELTAKSLAGMIDHAVLSPTATLEDLRSECQLAAKYNVASVCVKPCDVSAAAKLLANSPVKVGTVISFPHGSCSRQIKSAETARSIIDGAEEIDMVINFGRFISGPAESGAEFLRDEITAVVEAGQDKCVKVILECCYLNRQQITTACKVVKDTGAKFVKTSTGFGTGGATVQDVSLMREIVGPDFGVKASGGIRTLCDAVALINAGATRLGTSKTKEILAELNSLAAE